MSVRELLNELAGIEETVLLYHDGGKGRPRARRMLTDTTPTQDRLADLFGIDRYAPTRYRPRRWVIHTPPTKTTTDQHQQRPSTTKGGNSR